MTSLVHCCRTLLLTIAFVGVCSCQSLNIEKGASDFKLAVPRIQGGSKVDVREPYYFLARVVTEFPTRFNSPHLKTSKRKKPVNLERNLCTGTIITNEWVIIAAHCLFDRLGRKTTNITVTAGDISPVDVEGREVTSTAEAIIYPFYVHNGRKNNIAMLKLDVPVPFNPFIGAIKMTNSTNLPETGKDALVLGWGSNYGVEPFKPPYDRDVRVKKAALRRAFVKTSNKKTCRRRLRSSGAPWSFQVTDSTFCYTGKSEKLCFGNDGGPVIQNLNGQLVLVGINSFSRNKDVGGLYGDVQCDTDVPTVATRISSFYEKFIKPTVAGLDVLSPDYYDPE